MKQLSLVSTALVTMLLGHAAIAQVAGSTCAVDITSPANGERVDATGAVTGSSTLPPGTRLWILTHREGAGVWWPQGGGPAQVTEGRWSVLSYYGEPRDVGAKFEVTARVFDASGHRILSDWVASAAATGKYVGILAPPSIVDCPSKTITVKKQ
jgi:hypothetical protein